MMRKVEDGLVGLAWDDGWCLLYSSVAQSLVQSGCFRGHIKLPGYYLGKKILKRNVVHDCW